MNIVATGKEKKESLVLFAFRKSQKVFFNNLLPYCTQKKCTVITSKSIFSFSLRALNDISKVNLNKASHFAIQEFYAKTNIKIPKSILFLYFYTFSIINFLRYSSALDHGYTKMLIWNGGKFRQLIALEVARIKKIQVYFFENGLLPNTIVLDDRGINYQNSVPRDKDFFLAYKSDISLPTALVPRVGKNKNIFQGDKEPLPEKYIFVPFQVDYDTQIISQSRWIKNMRMFFDVISRVAKDTSYHFVLKEHPSSGIDYTDLHEKTKEMKNVMFRNTYSTQELIEKSLAVVTINSTVGIESLLFHKKVIVLGDAFYNIEGITYSAKNEQTLESLILGIESLSIDEVSIDNFLKYLYHEYLIPKDDTMYHTFCQKIFSDSRVKDNSIV